MKKLIKYSIILLISAAVIAITAFAYFIITPTTEQFDRSKVYATFHNLTITDYVGNNINHTQSKNFTKLEDINLHTINAFISIEDKNFYNHNGLNYKRIIKAGANNLASGSIREGASTISQQLIKNTHLSNEKTFKRKLKEIKLTKEMEKKLTKKEIFEGYLNAIYFGENAYGIKDAAKVYFNKEPNKLTLAESATLAGIIKAPALYSPITHENKCIARRNLVLKEMFNDSKITKDEYNNASKSNLLITHTPILNKNKNLDIYNKSVINEACEKLNISKEELFTSDYIITTYQDTKIQSNLQDIINGKKYDIKNTNGYAHDTLSVVLDNNTGGVLALAGKSDFVMSSSFLRQPGSAIKPILVFAPALEMGEINASTQILDEKINLDGYSPDNVGGVFHGNVSVRNAVSKSLNIPAVKTLQQIGIEKGKAFSKSAGIDFDKKDTGFAVALGGFTTGTTLTTLTNSYLPFANAGKYIPSNFIKEIKTKDGITIYKDKNVKTTIMGSDTAYLMTDLLISGVKEGTSKKLAHLPFEVAGKTGTVAVKNTNKNTDAISIAYTSNHTMGVWLGNYSMLENRHLEGSNNGGTYATEIIKDCFTGLYKDNPPQNFIVPDTVEYLEIDIKQLEKSNVVELCSPSTPERYRVKEIFSKRYPPTTTSTLFENYMVNDYNVSVENGNLQLSFIADDFITYQVCLLVDGNESILATVQDYSGLFNLNEQLFYNNKKAQVYLKYNYTHHPRTYLSHKKTIYIKTNTTSKFNSMQKQNDYAFLFA